MEMTEIKQKPVAQELEEEQEIFEIQDFTCATPWEILISAISKTLQKWGLNDGIEDVEDVWKDKMEDGVLSEDFEYLDIILTLKYQFVKHRAPGRTLKKKKQNPNLKTFSKSMCDMVSRERDHTILAPNISKYFGLTRYLTLSTKDENEIEEFGSTSFLLSTMNLGVNQVGCTLAFFIPMDTSGTIYQGGLQYGQYRISFRCRTQEKGPVVCSHLSGILEVFHRKTNLYIQDGDSLQSSERSKIAVTFTYIHFSKLEDEHWEQLLSEHENHSLMWGPNESPLKYIKLSSSWPFFPEGKFHENALYSDLNPLKAPKWEIEIEWEAVTSYDIESMRNSPLTAAVFQLLKLGTMTNFETWDEVVPSRGSTEREADRILDDIDEERAIHSLFKKPKNSNNVDKKKNLQFVEINKTAPFGSIANNLVQVILQTSLRFLCGELVLDLESFNLINVGICWKEFVSYVVGAWKNQVPIPDVEGAPDFKCSLLYQKLQLLNKCIIRMKKRSVRQMNRENDIQNESDEPRGIKAVKHNFCLINMPEIEINIPETLEQPMHTSDTLDKQFTVLKEIGTSKEATLKRAEMQNHQLKSDIAAFKAANPMGCLEDFIRWYSPNDWAQVDKELPKGQGIEGELSLRMKTEDNIWKVLWRETLPCPASSQPPLFHFEEEGERIVKWFENLTPMETLTQLGQISIGTIISILNNTKGSLANISPLIQSMEDLIMDSKSLWCWDDDVNSTTFDFERAMYWCKECGTTELVCARVVALLHYFPDEKFSRVIEALIRPPHATQLVEQFEREALRNIFCEDEDDEFPTPHRKQFTLFRTEANSRCGTNHSPSRLYASLSNDHFSVSSANGMYYG